LAGVVLSCCLLSGCIAISRRHVVPPAEIHSARSATEAELLAAYNEQAGAVRALNATVTMSPVAGSAYSGVIEEYHEVGGFIIAARPAMIRVIGQAPVVSKDIFDMVSDGRTFRIFIPSKNRFLVGSTALERAAKNPIENLRPQHILDAFFWPTVPAGTPVLFEEFDAPPSRFYVLSQVRSSGSALELARKVWFDRADLRVVRVQIYGAGGRLDSDIGYAHWEAATDSAPAGSRAGIFFPREIRIHRPQQDYQLNVSIIKLALNAEIPSDRFELVQPPGTELTEIDGDAEKESQKDAPLNRAEQRPGEHAPGVNKNFEEAK
jgi:outer membrane lipoprotein-sorting protein